MGKLKDIWNKFFGKKEIKADIEVDNKSKINPVELAPAISTLEKDETITPTPEVTAKPKAKKASAKKPSTKRTNSKNKK